MKTQKILFIALTVIFLTPFAGAKAQQEFTKTLNRTFEVDKNATLVLNNKFGKINCVTWDKPSISIEVTIKVEASGQKKADEIMDRIDVAIQGNRSRVSVLTTFEERISTGKNKIQVDFLVSMPASVNLDADHKFGDLIIETVEGNSQIRLSYGNFRIGSLSGKDNVLDIKYSNGNIGHLTNARLDLKYSGLDLDEADVMTISSKFSKLKIGKADVITMDSGYDDNYIGFVRDIDIKGSFSNVEIRSLEEKILARMDYGDLKVRETGMNFKLINITTKFADANIGIHSNASYRVSATVKLGSFKYPKQKAKMSEVDLSHTSGKYEGLIGDNADTPSKVLIDARNGGVTLYYR